MSEIGDKKRECKRMGKRVYGIMSFAYLLAYGGRWTISRGRWWNLDTLGVHTIDQDTGVPQLGVGCEFTWLSVYGHQIRNRIQQRWSFDSTPAACRNLAVCIDVLLQCPWSGQANQKAMSRPWPTLAAFAHIWNFQEGIRCVRKCTKLLVAAKSILHRVLAIQTPPSVWHSWHRQGLT